MSDGLAIVRAAALGDAERIFALIGRSTDMLVPRSLGSVVENIDRFVVAHDLHGGFHILGRDGHILFVQFNHPLPLFLVINGRLFKKPGKAGEDHA